jgi:Ran GTPase-activating protein (RanGAP) involved in mRNA processing and transport
MSWLIDSCDRTYDVKDACRRLQSNAATVRVLEVGAFNKGEGELLAAALRSNTVLKGLKLSLYAEDSGLEAPAVVDALKGNATVNRLEFSAKVDGAGMQGIMDLLKANQSLTMFTMRGVHFGDEGAQFIANALRSNGTLTGLWLQADQISNAGAEALASALTGNLTLRRLCLPLNLVDFAGAEAMAASLKGNNVLTELCLDGNDIGASGAMALANVMNDMGSLSILSLAHNGIGDLGLCALAGQVKHNRTLTRLLLRANGIRHVGVVALAKGLEGNYVLKQLYLDDNDIGDEGAAALATVLDQLTQPRLCTGSISHVGFQAIAEALKFSKTLTTLELWSCSGMGDVGMLAMAAALRSNRAIRALALSSTSCGEAGIRAVVEALVGTNTVTELDLSGNKIGDELAGVLCRGLSYIVKLNLAATNIAEAGVQRIAEMLSRNGSLTKLDIDSNNIGDLGVQALGKALAHNDTLAYLCLERRNGFSLIGHGAFTRAFSTNFTLCDMWPLDFVAYTTRNVLIVRNRELKCQQAALILIGLKRLSRAPCLRSNAKDVVRLIARMVWSTRTKAAWDDSVAQPSPKRDALEELHQERWAEAEEGLGDGEEEEEDEEEHDNSMDEDGWSSFSA